MTITMRGEGKKREKEDKRALIGEQADDEAKKGKVGK